MDLQAQGLGVREIGRRLGVNHATVSRHLQAAQINSGQMKENPGIAAALENTGITADRARFGYRRVKREDGSFDTVMWKLSDLDRDNVMDRIAAKMADIPAVAEVKPPKETEADRLDVYPFFDLHLGQSSRANRTGEDVDNASALDRFRAALTPLVGDAEEAVLIFGGDTLHLNDKSKATPKSKHVLDVDGCIFDAIEAGVEAVAFAVDLALERHGALWLIIIPGNHDPDSYLALLFAMVERYRDNPRVRISKSPAAQWAMSWGRNLIAAHHGNGVTPERLVLSLAEHPDWSACPYRHIFTGHVHHAAGRQIGGAYWESVGPVTRQDAYASDHAYVTRSVLSRLSFHRDGSGFDRAQRHIR